MVLDEAEAHVRVPAKIAVDFFRMSRSMRSGSFSSRSRAISEAWPAGIGGACVVGRRVADAGSFLNLSTQRRNTESRRPSSLSPDVIDRPLETTSSAGCHRTGDRGIRIVDGDLQIRPGYRGLAEACATATFIV